MSFTLPFDLSSVRFETSKEGRTIGNNDAYIVFEIISSKVGELFLCRQISL